MRPRATPFLALVLTVPSVQPDCEMSCLAEASVLPLRFGGVHAFRVAAPPPRCPGVPALAAGPPAGAPPPRGAADAFGAAAAPPRCAGRPAFAPLPAGVGPPPTGVVNARELRIPSRTPAPVAGGAAGAGGVTVGVPPPLVAPPVPPPPPPLAP